MYSNCDCDAILFAGDVNSRLGKCNDYIEGIDNVPQRQLLDEVKITHGEVFLDFLLEANMCILIGRITPQFDNYTSVSVNGRSIVDYLPVSH